MSKRKRRFELIPGWQHVWRMYTTWMFAFLGAAGNIYNFCHDLGLLDNAKIPTQFIWFLRISAVAGIVLRIVQQKRLRAKVTEARRRKRLKTKRRKTTRGPSPNGSVPSGTGSSETPA